MTINDPLCVSVSVSDPWEFQDENDGRASFDAEIIATTRDHRWVVRFFETLKSDKKCWSYAGLLVRHLGQAYFDDPDEEDRAANIMLMPEDIAVGTDWKTSALDVTYGPCLIGAVDVNRPIMTDTDITEP